jgi:uncharacterized repeat protein (TIGR03803 family)
MDPSGNLFGTAGTIGSGGLIYELTPSADKRRWSFTIVHKFCTRKSDCLQGKSPSGLIMDVAGNLYGTASQGGTQDKGTVFELTPAGSKWTLNVLFNFCTIEIRHCKYGSYPLGLTYAGVLSGALYDGVSPLFAVTDLGGYLNQGTIFKLTRNGSDWSETVIQIFRDAAEPGPIVADAQGNLFGNLNYRGKYGYGQVYEFPHDTDQEHRLHDFCAGGEPCADGGYPAGPLAIDSGGILVGVTSRGGNQTDGGVAFTLNPKNRDFRVVYDFCSLANCADGSFPWGMTADGSGNFYGMTLHGGGVAGAGVAFQLRHAAGWSETVLHAFCSEANCQDGASPNGTLTIDPSGNLYGVTYGGGKYGKGTVYELTP